MSKNQLSSSHERQQPPRGVGADRLEAALGVAEAGAEGAAQQQVVAARDHLALRAAQHACPGRQPGADREVGVTAEQRSHQRQQGVQVRRQVDVHVDEDVCRRRDQAVFNASPRPLLRHMDHARHRRAARASRSATSGVRSVLALSAMVTRDSNGTSAR